MFGRNTHKLSRGKNSIGNQIKKLSPALPKTSHSTNPNTPTTTHPHHLTPLTLQRRSYGNLYRLRILLNDLKKNPTELTRVFSDFTNERIPTLHRRDRDWRETRLPSKSTFFQCLQHIDHSCDVIMVSLGSSPPAKTITRHYKGPLTRVAKILTKDATTNKKVTSILTIRRDPRDCLTWSDNGCMAVETNYTFYWANTLFRDPPVEHTIPIWALEKSMLNAISRPQMAPLLVYWLPLVPRFAFFLSAFGIWAGDRILSNPARVLALQDGNTLETQPDTFDLNNKMVNLTRKIFTIMDKMKIVRGMNFDDEVKKERKEDGVDVSTESNTNTATATTTATEPPSPTDPITTTNDNNTSTIKKLTASVADTLKYYRAMLKEFRKLMKEEKEKMSNNNNTPQDQSNSTPTTSQSQYYNVDPQLVADLVLWNRSYGRLSRLDPELNTNIKDYYIALKDFMIGNITHNWDDLTSIITNLIKSEGGNETTQQNSNLDQQQEGANIDQNQLQNDHLTQEQHSLTSQLPDLSALTSRLPELSSVTSLITTPITSNILARRAHHLSAILRALNLNRDKLVQGSFAQYSITTHNEILAKNQSAYAKLLNEKREKHDFVVGAYGNNDGGKDDEEDNETYIESDTTKTISHDKLTNHITYDDLTIEALDRRLELLKNNPINQFSKMELRQNHLQIPLTDAQSFFDTANPYSNFSLSRSKLESDFAQQLSLQSEMLDFFTNGIVTRDSYKEQLIDRMLRILLQRRHYESLCSSLQKYSALSSTTFHPLINHPAIATPSAIPDIKKFPTLSDRLYLSLPRSIRSLTDRVLLAADFTANAPQNHVTYTSQSAPSPHPDQNKKQVGISPKISKEVYDDILSVKTLLTSSPDQIVDKIEDLFMATPVSHFYMQMLHENHTKAEEKVVLLDLDVNPTINMNCEGEKTLITQEQMENGLTKLFSSMINPAALQLHQQGFDYPLAGMALAPRRYYSQDDRKELESNETILKQNSLIAREIFTGASISSFQALANLPKAPFNEIKHATQRIEEEIKKEQLGGELPQQEQQNTLPTFDQRSLYQSSQHQSIAEQQSPAQNSIFQEPNTQQQQSQQHQPQDGNVIVNHYTTPLGQEVQKYNDVLMKSIVFNDLIPSYYSTPFTNQPFHLRMLQDAYNSQYINLSREDHDNDQYYDQNEYKHDDDKNVIQKMFSNSDGDSHASNFTTPKDQLVQTSSLPQSIHLAFLDLALGQYLAEYYLLMQLDKKETMGQFMVKQEQVTRQKEQGKEEKSENQPNNDIISSLPLQSTQSTKSSQLLSALDEAGIDPKTLPKDMTVDCALYIAQFKIKSEQLVALLTPRHSYYPSSSPTQPITTTTTTTPTTTLTSPDTNSTENEDKQQNSYGHYQQGLGGGYVNPFALQMGNHHIMSQNIAQQISQITSSTQEISQIAPQIPTSQQSIEVVETITTTPTESAIDTSQQVNV